jgi:hypothetical protein
MSSSQPDTSGAARIQADATTQAAQLQAQSQKEALAQQQSMFEQQQKYLQEQDVYNRGITQQNQGNYNPYIQAGQGALSSLNSAVNDQGSWLNHSFNQQDMQQDDGYQFRLDQGNQSLNASLAAKGGLLSGAALKAASGYNQNMASEEYNNAYQRFTNDKSNRYSILNNMSNLGLQGAAGFAGGSPQSTTGTQLSNVAGQYGNNISNITTQGANAQSNLLLSNAQQQAQYKLMGSGGSGLGGALSGAASGAAMGSSFGPWGTAIGAVGGALASIL